MNFNGKNLLITDAASQSGKAFARQMACAGANIIALSSDPIQLAILQGELLEESITIRPYLWNENNPRHLYNIFNAIRAQHGSLHFIINNSTKFLKPGLHELLTASTKNLVEILPQNNQSTSDMHPMFGARHPNNAVRKVLKTLEQTIQLQNRGNPVQQGRLVY